MRKQKSFRIFNARPIHAGGKCLLLEGAYKNQQRTIKGLAKRLLA